MNKDNLLVKKLKKQFLSINNSIEISGELPEDLFGGGDPIIEPMNAEKFAKKISSFIKKQFGYPSKVTTLGLGKARITIGEK